MYGRTVLRIVAETGWQQLLPLADASFRWSAGFPQPIRRFVMAHYNQPTKREIRMYMERRAESKKPPPDMKEIRRILGWELVEMARNGTQRR